eukprot:350250_1
MTYKLVCKNAWKMACRAVKTAGCFKRDTMSFCYNIVHAIMLLMNPIVIPDHIYVSSQHDNILSACISVSFQHDNPGCMSVSFQVGPPKPVEPAIMRRSVDATNIICNVEAVTLAKQQETFPSKKVNDKIPKREHLVPTIALYGPIKLNFLNSCSPVVSWRQSCTAWSASVDMVNGFVASLPTSAANKHCISQTDKPVLHMREAFGGGEVREKIIWKQWVDVNESDDMDVVKEDEIVHIQNFRVMRFAVKSGMIVLINFNLINLCRK